MVIFLSYRISCGQCLSSVFSRWVRRVDILTKNNALKATHVRREAKSTLFIQMNEINGCHRIRYECLSAMVRVL